MSEAKFIPCPVTTAALKYSDSIALADDNQTLTWRELDLVVSGAADALRNLGIGRGNRVALLGDNSVELAAALWATIRLGAIVCPISTRWPRAKIDEALQLIAADLVVIGTVDKPKTRYAPTTVYVSQLLETEDSQKPFVDISPVGPATIIFTSGSSGEAKAAVHSLQNHLCSAAGIIASLEFGESDAWLLSLPLYHVGGLAILFRSIVSGGVVVIPERTKDLDKVLGSHRITHLSVVPTQLHRLLHSPKLTRESIDALKIVLLGGGPPNPIEVDLAIRRGFPVVRSYGLTEMCSTVCLTDLQDGPERLKSSGRPLQFREISVADDREILVRGATLFKGYLKGDRIDLPLSKDGWFRTGDLGSIDGHGYLTVSGRKDNRFFSGGENIQPEEIEARLMQLEEVSAAVVVPVDDPEYGQCPVAFVKSTGKCLFDEKIARRSLESLLPRFMLPTKFFSWPENLDGEMKTDRRRLARLAEELIQAGAK